MRWKGIWTYELAGILLAIGAALLLSFREHNTLDARYLLLLVAGAAGISWTVGYVMGYLTEKGLEPTGEGEGEERTTGPGKG